MDLRRRNIIAEQFLLIMKQKLDLVPGTSYFDFKFFGTGDYMGGVSSATNPEGIYLSKLKELTEVTNEEFLQVLNYCYSQKFIIGAQQYIRLTARGMQKANEIEDKIIEQESEAEISQLHENKKQITKLTFIDRQILEKFFDMGSGYVLNFSNKTFEEFFKENFNVNIYDKKYDYASGSKANRLRAFWEKESIFIVASSIEKLIEYWKTNCLLYNIPMEDNKQKLAQTCLNIAGKIRGEAVGGQASRKEEDDFLKKNFAQINFKNLGVGVEIQAILNQRLNEIEICLKNEISLGALFLIGSTLEGFLFGVAQRYPKEFNTAKAAPRNHDDKVKPLDDWTLSSLIDVSYEVGCLGLDVKKYSHVLRDFRNYIHPNEQLKHHFNPDLHTVQISRQVLLAAMKDLSDFNLARAEISH